MHLPELADYVRRTLDASNDAEDRCTTWDWNCPVYVQGRYRGRYVSDAWSTAGNCQEQSLQSSLLAIRDRLAGKRFDTVLICFCEKSIPCDWNLQSCTLTSDHQHGMIGHEFFSPEGKLVLRVSPFELISTNRTLQKALENQLAHPGTPSGEAGQNWKSFSFSTRQFCVPANPTQAAYELYRGFPLVCVNSIDHRYIQRLLSLMSSYLRRSVQADGRMIYMYYPSRGQEDTQRNNSIRQWMATRALIHLNRSDHHQPLGSLDELISRNIAFNMHSMYREQGEFGFIVEAGKIKLGAIALAALALWESDSYSGFQPEFRLLCNTVMAMWQESGRFQTFLAPAGRDDCHNFYPGEALLLWAHLLCSKLDTQLLERFSRSFHFYGDWHRQARNPAFVPWHTLAYVKLWTSVQDPQLVEAVFEMNDWLLTLQQWDDAPSPDCRGRFYALDKPFGPPHASSTAVYLEGLASATWLAEHVNDPRRASIYRRAILRGIRSIAQLTYKDDRDFCFISKRGRLLGGVRTNEYNNIVRVDSVQHSVMALLGVLDKVKEQ